MKRILFVLMLLCGIDMQAMDLQENPRSSIALEELVLFGKIITSCLICVQHCDNASPTHKVKSLVVSTAASCSSCASHCSAIQTCCCLPFACYEHDENSDGSAHQRIVNYSPVFHPHHNIYNGSPRSLKD